jgi:hypothetical protein
MPTLEAAAAGDIPTEESLPSSTATGATEDVGTRAVVTSASRPRKRSRHAGPDDASTAVDSFALDDFTIMESNAPVSAVEKLDIDDFTITAVASPGVRPVDEKAEERPLPIAPRPVDAASAPKPGPNETTAAASASDAASETGKSGAATGTTRASSTATSAPEARACAETGPGLEHAVYYNEAGEAIDAADLTASERRRIAAEERTFRRIVESCGCEVSPSLGFPWTPAAEAADLLSARCALLSPFARHVLATQGAGRDLPCYLFDTRGPKIWVDLLTLPNARALRQTLRDGFSGPLGLAGWGRAPRKPVEPGPSTVGGGRRAGGGRRKAAKRRAPAARRKSAPRRIESNSAGSENDPGRDAGFRLHVAYRCRDGQFAWLDDADRWMVFCATVAEVIAVPQPATFRTRHRPGHRGR